MSKPVMVQPKTRNSDSCVLKVRTCPTMPPRKPPTLPMKPPTMSRPAASRESLLVKFHRVSTSVRPRARIIPRNMPRTAASRTWWMCEGGMRPSTQPM
jgi:hypothetical protein